MACSCATALTRSAPTTSGMVTAGARTRTVDPLSATPVTPDTGVTGVGTGRGVLRAMPSPRGWLRRMVKGIAHPYHPWGLGGSWLASPRRWGIDPDACPSLDQVLDVRRERMNEVHDVIAGVTAEELERNCVPPGSPGHPRKDHTVLQCLQVILKEEWQHHRYAVRDLAVLEKRPR
jgi:DinB superfamily